MADLDDLLSAIAGKRIPGGCDECDAEQRVDEVVPGCWKVTVAHDNDCPTWRAVNAGAN
jgi:hypothetical protein